MRASMKYSDALGRLVGLGQALRKRRMEHVLFPVLCSWIRTELICSLLWKSLFSAFIVPEGTRVCGVFAVSYFGRLCQGITDADSIPLAPKLCGSPFAV